MKLFASEENPDLLRAGMNSGKKTSSLGKAQVVRREKVLCKKIRKKSVIWNAIVIIGIGIFLIVLNLFLYKLFSRRALAFGCFDDCFNYMGGYFMVHGKTPYSDFFFNHMMGMAYLSFFIQKFHHSINLYDLILTHRQVIMLFAFFFDFILIKRFKWTGLWFVIGYELTKFYVFGDRFLGESLLVYAAVYMVGLIWEKALHKKFSYFDFIISGVFTWFIIIMREPYIPLGVFLYAFLLWGGNKQTENNINSYICISLRCYRNKYKYSRLLF